MINITILFYYYYFFFLIIFFFFIVEDSQPAEKEEEEEGAHSCEEEGCTRSFKTNRGLKLHINQIHRGIGRIKSLTSFKDEIGDLQCEKCDKTFNKPSKLSMHMVSFLGVEYMLVLMSTFYCKVDTVICFIMDQFNH